MIYLLDTSIIIDFLEGVASAKKVLSNIKGNTAISTITIAELWRILSPKTSDADRKKIKEFTQALTIIPFGEEEGEYAASIGGKARKLPLGDRLIAGTALAHGATVVTRDAHFTRIEGLTVLKY